jgi:hypothetical protein
MNNIDFLELRKEENSIRIPDGTIYVNKINENNFDYIIQVNDVKIPFYHRSNGVTKTSVFNKNKGDNGGNGWVSK